ncbi:MAG: DUF6702 family protein [Saprospiraceae bacterium]
MTLVLFLAVYLSNLVHPHHQSITDIKYEPDDKAFDISLTVTAHDIEKILSIKSKSPISLSNKKDSLHNAEVLFDYVERNFVIKMDKTNIDFDFLGFESEQDETTIYFQSEEFNFIPDEIILENTILMDYESDQQNIINFKYFDKVVNRKLTIEKPRIQIKLKG